MGTHSEWRYAAETDGESILAWWVPSHKDLTHPLHCESEAPLTFWYGIRLSPRASQLGLRLLPWLNRNTQVNKFLKAHVEKNTQASLETISLLSRNLLALGNWGFRSHHHEGDLCSVLSVHLTNEQGLLHSGCECEEQHGLWELSGA